MEKHEIEELIKAVNKNAVKAMLRNAAILDNPNMSDEMKALAIENVKAIVGNRQGAKKTKLKSVEQPIQPVPVAAAPEAPKMEYPQGLHLSPLNTAGHDENAMKGIFDSLPDHEKKSIIDWHSGIQMKKSVDTLYNLFVELKKHL